MKTMKRMFVVSLMITIFTTVSGASANLNLVEAETEAFFNSIEQIEIEKDSLAAEIYEIKEMEIDKIMDESYNPLGIWSWIVVIAIVTLLLCFLSCIPIVICFNSRKWDESVKDVLLSKEVVISIAVFLLFLIIGGSSIYYIGWKRDKGTYSTVDLGKREFLEKELNKKLSSNQEYMDLALQYEALDAKKTLCIKEFQAECNLEQIIEIKHVNDSIEARNQQILETCKKNMLLRPSNKTSKNGYLFLMVISLCVFFVLILIKRKFNSDSEDLGVLIFLSVGAFFVSTAFYLGLLEETTSETMPNSEKNILIEYKAKKKAMENHEFRENERTILFNNAVLKP